MLNLVFQLSLSMVTTLKVQKCVVCNRLHFASNWSLLEIAKFIKQNVHITGYSLCVTGYVPSIFQKYQTEWSGNRLHA